MGGEAACPCSQVMVLAPCQACPPLWPTVADAAKSLTLRAPYRLTGRSAGWRTCISVTGCPPTASRSSPGWTGSASTARSAGLVCRCGHVGWAAPGRSAVARIPRTWPALLADLYLSRRLTTRQIGELLGTPEKRVRDRLCRHGIQVRTRGAWQRENRRSLPADTLRTLYLQYGLTADEVGREVDASRKIVLRNAHDLGLPVRAAVAVPSAAPAEIMLIRELYSDELVQPTLVRHNIVPVPAGAPIWQRFPETVPLTRRLVTDLYWICGLAFSHVELITGQPASTVRGFMQRSGLASRPPGQRSPFLRRCQGSPSPDGTGPEGALECRSPYRAGTSRGRSRPAEPRRRAVKSRQAR